jgi:DNA polymerase-3 subunit epsilon
VAKAYELTRDQVRATHRAFALALAHRIVEDGKVTHDERRQLREVTEALGITDALPQQIIDEAFAARHEELAGAHRPLPSDWRHGEPLRQGQGVVFTGCDPLQRARLEGRAQAAGLRVTGSVSRRTAVLVTDGDHPNTGKARAARELGTRVVSPAVFAALVESVQPASVPQPRVQDDGEAVRAADPPAPTPFLPQADRPEDPATIRAWAREQGLDIGLRGRIPASVLAAYRASG